MIMKGFLLKSWQKHKLRQILKRVCKQDNFKKRHYCHFEAKRCLETFK